MTRRLTDCVKYTDLNLAHHKAFWEAVEAKLPPGSLANDGELGSIWVSAVPAKPTPDPAWVAPAIKIIKEWEGLRLSAYKDAGGVPTIGFGTTRYADGPVRMGDTITASEAETLLRRDVVELYGPGIQHLIPSSKHWSANRMAAMTSFVYNVGLGALETSTMRKRMNSGEGADVVFSSEAPRWNKVDGMVLEGLSRRRAAEVKLFTGGSPVQSFTPASPFSYRITPNITYGEFALQSEARRFIKQHQCDTAIELARFAQKARDHFKRPVIITSGYRPPKINAEVGGASRSEHLYDAPDTGAIDFYIDGMSVTELQRWADKEWPFSLGYGAPKGFIHIGIRPGRPRVRWDY
jgi:GH24 family phage-related lysozyme (muramidase)